MPFTIDQLEELRAKSVKADDAFQFPAGRILQVLVPAASPSVPLPPRLPPSLKERDRFLAMTPRCEAQWGCANGIAITKVASLAWDVQGDVALRAKKARGWLLNADWVNGPGGWIPFVSKQLRDFNNTNNGCHFEIIRKTKAYGSEILGIAHLSSRACYRTGDPENPIIYRDKLGFEHLMKWWQVISIADLPESDEWFFGAGLCAAERAYPQIIKMAAIEMFVYEKVAATRPLAIHIVNGIMSDDIEDLLQNAQDQMIQRGLTSFMGAVIMATIKPDAAPALVTIPLAELPAGFNAEEERERADLIYANALGLDPQDLRPMTNQNLGAGAQSQVLHDKGKGKGLIVYRQAMVHHLNELVLDDKTKFLFTEKDYDDQLKQAQVSQARTQNAVQRVTAQLTQPAQELQLLVDQDELPKWFIPEDKTTSETLSDTDKPEADESETTGTDVEGAITPPVAASPAPKPAVGVGKPIPIVDAKASARGRAKAPFALKGQGAALAMLKRLRSDNGLGKQAEDLIRGRTARTTDGRVHRNARRNRRQAA